MLKIFCLQQNIKRNSYDFRAFCYTWTALQCFKWWYRDPAGYATQTVPSSVYDKIEFNSICLSSWHMQSNLKNHLRNRIKHLNLRAYWPCFQIRQHHKSALLYNSNKYSLWVLILDLQKVILYPFEEKKHTSLWKFGGKKKHRRANERDQSYSPIIKIVWNIYSVRGGEQRNRIRSNCV